MGITARQLIEEHGGGVWKGRQAKAVVPGGISMGFMSAAELDTPLDFNGPGKVGCLGLGTAAVTVVDDQTSMVDVLFNCARFFAHESCGQCTPCREGGDWLYKILQRIERGEGQDKDIDLLFGVSSNIVGKTLCAFGDAAATPVLSTLKLFRHEYEAHVREHRCTLPASWRASKPMHAGAH